MRVNGLAIGASILLIACGDGNCQQLAKSAPAEPKTKLESFDKQTGAVLIKGFSDPGKVTGMGVVSVMCMEFTDASTGKRQTGIVIEVTESVGRSDRSFIDYDEIDALLKGIDYICKIRPDATRLANFEAIYKTKGDVSVTTFSSSGKIDAAVKSGYIGSATAYFSLQQLAEFKGLIAKAKQKLDSLQ